MLFFSFCNCTHLKQAGCFHVREGVQIPVWQPGIQRIPCEYRAAPRASAASRRARGIACLPGEKVRHEAERRSGPRSDALAEMHPQVPPCALRTSRLRNVPCGTSRPQPRLSPTARYGHCCDGSSGTDTLFAIKSRFKELPRLPRQKKNSTVCNSFKSITGRLNSKGILAFNINSRFLSTSSFSAFRKDTERPKILPNPLASSQP